MRDDLEVSAHRVCGIRLPESHVQGRAPAHGRPESTLPRGRCASSRHHSQLVPPADYDAAMARWIALLSSRRVRYVFIAASVLGLVIGLDTLVLHLRLDPLADVRAYYDAGARLNAGLPLYEQPATTERSGLLPLSAAAGRRLPAAGAAPVRDGGAHLGGAAASSCSSARSSGSGSATSGRGSSPAGWPHRSPGASRSARRRSRSRSCSRSGRRGRSRSPATSRSCRSSWWSTGSAGATGGRSGVRGLVRRVDGRDVHPRAGGHRSRSSASRTSRQVGEVQNLSLYAISPVLWAASVVALLVLALRYAPTRAGWPLAVAASVLVTPAAADVPAVNAAGRGAPTRRVVRRRGTPR